MRIAGKTGLKIYRTVLDRNLTKRYTEENRNLTN